MTRNASAPALESRAHGAHAAVRYEFAFEDLGLGFTYTAPDFITAKAVIAVGDLDQCVSPVGEACDAAYFEPGFVDGVGLLTVNGGLRTYGFLGGSLGKAGTYDYGYSLKVTDLSAAVPEPSAWVLMIAGVGLAGADLRRRRAIA